jgi:hypothetical protein
VNGLKIEKKRKKVERHKSFCSSTNDERNPQCRNLGYGVGWNRENRKPSSITSSPNRLLFLNVARQFYASSRSQSANTKHTQKRRRRRQRIKR